MLLILTGKTASGKDTIVSELLRRNPDFKKVLTTTSRIPREGEQDEVDYYFITKEQFNKKIKAGDFIEYVEYGGNFYGTTKSEIKVAINQNSIWRIDPSRAGEVRDFIKRSFPKNLAEKIIQKFLVIYINTTEDIILQRLRDRNLSEDEIDQRMADDASIWQEFKDKYDYIVENVPGKLDEAVNRITKILRPYQHRVFAEYPR